MKLGIVIPVYNEAHVVGEMFERLLATPAPALPDGSRCTRVVVLVDDGSTDGSGELIDGFADAYEGVVVTHLPHNLGKGSALKAGFKAALDAGAGAVIVQDADMEYDPADHAPLLEPILAGRADAVIGTRFLGQTHRVLYYWHSVANRAITTASNMLSNLNLTDVECGLKAFSRLVAERLDLRERRFGVEIELVATLAKMRLDEGDGPRPLRIYEAPVRYAGRTYAEGKKIRWTDGVEALWCVLKHNLG